MRHVTKSLLLIFLWAISMTSHAMTSQLRELKDEEGTAFVGRYSASGILEAYDTEARTIFPGNGEPTPQQRGQLQTLAWETVRRMAQHTGLATIENRTTTPTGQMKTTYYFAFNPDWVKTRLSDLQRQNFSFRAHNTAINGLLAETATLAVNWTQHTLPTASLLQASNPILEEQIRIRQESQNIAESEIQRIKGWQEAAATWQKNELTFVSPHYSQSQKQNFFLPMIDSAHPIVGYVSQWDAEALASDELQGIWASLLPHLETLMAGHFTIGNPRPPVAEPEGVAAEVSADGAGGSGSASSAAASEGDMNEAGSSSSATAAGPSPAGAKDDHDTVEEEKAADA